MNQSFKAKFKQLSPSCLSINHIKVNIDSFSTLFNNVEKTLKVQITHEFSLKMIRKDQSYSMEWYMDTLIVEFEEDQIQMKVYSDKDHIYLSDPEGKQELIEKFKDHMILNQIRKKNRNLIIIF